MGCCKGGVLTEGNRWMKSKVEFERGLEVKTGQGWMVTKMM